MNYTAQEPQARAVAIIPARFSSTRLPGKPLVEIAGRPLIVHVIEQVKRARNIARVIVATDDTRILDVVNESGYEAVMTRADHMSGSDRISEVAAALDDFEIIVNVQGDEPLISPRTIERAVDELLNDKEALIVTTSEEIAEIKDVLSFDVVKVVVDESGHALYFSRAPIPHLRDEVRRHGSLENALHSDPSLLLHFRKHTGLYAYRRKFLLEYTRWPPSQLERAEALEQLRALERGVKIKVLEADEASIGVDTPEDLERVREIFKETRAKAGARP